LGGAFRYPSPMRPVPVPTQRRASETIRAAVEATVDLLESLNESQVTLEAIRLRSGVSQGSLTHHFGSRQGLIAAAQVERYARNCAADAAFIGQLDGQVSAPGPFARTMLGLIADMLMPERRTARWVRMSAVAAAYRDPALGETIGHAYTSLADRLTALVEQAHGHDVLQRDIDARTIALLLSMQAQGLVLDDLIGAEAVASSWNHLQVRFVSCFLTPMAALELARQERERFGDLWRAETFGEPGRVPREVAGRLALLRGDGDERDPDTEDATVPLGDLLAQVTLGGEDVPRRRPSPVADARARILDQACSMLRDGGEGRIDVAALRDAAGISPQAFHRMFGDREALVRLARIRVEVERATASTARFTDWVTHAAAPADMRSALVDGAISMAGEAQRAAMLQRIETLAATRTDPELRDALARLQRVARDLHIEQVCRAQARGTFDPTLPPSALARLLDGTVFWHVFHGLDRKRPDPDAWIAMLRRIAWMLSPDR